MHLCLLGVSREIISFCQLLQFYNLHETVPPHFQNKWPLLFSYAFSNNDFVGIYFMWDVAWNGVEHQVFLKGDQEEINNVSKKWRTCVKADD